MDSVGGFVEVEDDGNVSLVYQHPKYHPIPPTQRPSPDSEQVCDDLIPQPLFLCPVSRLRGDWKFLNKPEITTFPFISTPECIFPTRSPYHHPVLPLFWCNNNEIDASGGCDACGGSKFGTTYYYCDHCDSKFHRECVQSPLQIKHPYHPHHSLQLSFLYDSHNIECLCCQRSAFKLVYYCSLCRVVMHPFCAMEAIPFVIDPPKRHHHPLTYFPRQTSLTCNVCGLLRPHHPTYVCLRCNFVAHNDCMHSPSIIKISRHHHRISYISSLQPGEWSCGVCRQSINGEYGAYTCDKCGDYAVHSRCALREDVWDGEELEDVPEEDDITLDAEPFRMISERVILHFLHDHPLQLEVNILYDENKICQACVLPIFEGDFYSCIKCDFVLHETCVKSRRRIHHPLHPHVLTLKAICRYDGGAFACNACNRCSSGFVYECRKGECDYDLDVRCATISEPFNYQGHNHPLFLSLAPEEKPVCEVCKLVCKKQLNCIKCNFVVCFKCATLPFKARYKHDKHFLTLLWGEDVCEKDWCEVCELNLKDTETKMFYWCKDCCTTLHVACLFGEDPYLKPGQVIRVYKKEVQILGKSNATRPICDSCKKRCQHQRFTRDNRIACSYNCARRFVYASTLMLDSSIDCK